MKTNYLQNKLLEHLTGKTTYTKPTNTFVGLMTEDPGVDANVVEPVGGGYTREQASWASAANGLIETNAQIVFENMPYSTIKYWGIFDASSAGNLLEYFAFEKPIKIPSGEDFTIEAGNLILRER